MSNNRKLQFVDCRFSILLVLDRSASTQNIELKTGQVIETTGIRLSGDTVMGKITVGATTGEVGYPIAAIAKIAFPEPRGLQTARDLLSQGQPEKALNEIDPVVKYYDPLKSISGAWWAPAALMKVSALAALKRDIDAEVLANEIRANSTSPEISRAAQLRVAAKGGANLRCRHSRKHG